MVFKRFSPVLEETTLTGTKPIDKIETGRMLTQINTYIHYLIKERHITESYQNQICCAIKMFYAAVANQPEKVEGLVQARKPQKIPQVLLEGEVTRLLKAVDNLKWTCEISRNCWAMKVVKRRKFTRILPKKVGKKSKVLWMIWKFNAKKLYLLKLKKSTPNACISIFTSSKCPLAPPSRPPKGICFSSCPHPVYCGQ